jgi:hypothetical protein
VFWWYHDDEDDSKQIHQDSNQVHNLEENEVPACFNSARAVRAEIHFLSV